MIRDLNFHYLTLTTTKKGPYWNEIAIYHARKESRDRAEKFIRDLKERAEMRPVRHRSKYAVIGYVLIVFLTNVLVSLTQLFCENPVVKNLKVIKKYLTNLTLTIVYPSFGYPIKIISNFSQELHTILGDFVKRYGNLEVPNLW